MSYSLERNEGKVVSIKRDSDGVHIPIDGGNRDYIAFSAWNDLQSPPLDFSDDSYAKMVSKDNDLYYEIESLTNAQQMSILCALAARALQQEPNLLTDTISEHD